MLFFSAEPYIWGDIYKSWDEFAATKLLRKLLRLGCFWCSEPRRKLRKSGVLEVGSTPVGDASNFNDLADSTSGGRRLYGIYTENSRVKRPISAFPGCAGFRPVSAHFGRVDNQASHSRPGSCGCYRLVGRSRRGLVSLKGRGASAAILDSFRLG